MFDILGIIAFLFMAFSLIALILSVFNRRMNQKLWIILFAVSTALIIGSYYLDMAFDKEEPVVIDYSDVTPDPSPTAKPTPTPKATPTTTITPTERTERKTNTPAVTPTSVETPSAEIELHSVQPEVVPTESTVSQTPNIPPESEEQSPEVTVTEQ